MIRYLRLSSVQVGLDEDLANAYILKDLTKCILHGLPCPQDGDATDLFCCDVFTLIWYALRSFNSYVLQ